MVIRVTCPSCENRFNVDDDLRGKKVRCRECKETVTVPSTTSCPDEAISERPRAGSVGAGKRKPRNFNDPNDDHLRDRSPSLLVPLLLGGGALAALGVLIVGGLATFFLITTAAVAPNEMPVAEVEAPIVPPAMAGTIPIPVLERIKDATAFIKMDVGVRSGSGSGFVMRTDGDTAYVVTNDHVVSVPAAEIIGIGRLKPQTPPVAAAKPRITVVLRSGTPREQVFPAEVLATDPEADLAILRITGVREMPKPIDFSQQPALVETMPLFIFGFPFGKALATSKGSNPAITVGQGTISSLRRDDRGELSVVQINGDLNPGNSGGPVVDVKGRLIGVSVAAVRGTQIGMAIPSADLSQMLAGRAQTAAVFKKNMVGNNANVHGEMWYLDRFHKVKLTRGLTLRLNNVAPGAEAGDFEVEAKLLDPLKHIQSVALFYARADNPPQALPNGQGRWDPLPGAHQVDLKIEEQKAIGSLTLAPGVQPEGLFCFQLGLVNGAGQTVYTQPRSFRLNFSAADVALAPPLLNPAPAVAQFGPEVTVTLKITGVTNAQGRKYIVDRLPAMIGGGPHWVHSSTIPKGLSVILGPVADPQAFAKKIDFGKVTDVDGRTISVVAATLDIPKASAELVTQALADLQSTSSIQRTRALERLASVAPHERRSDVVRAVEKLIAEPDVFVRRAAIKALAVWGAKEQIPVLGTALAHSDVFTRKAAIEALAQFTDEQQAADLIAQRLPENSERGDASRALQGMSATGQKAALTYLKHAQWIVRIEVCNILKVVGTQECLAALQAVAAEDPNALVRRVAGEASQIVATRK